MSPRALWSAASSRTRIIAIVAGVVVAGGGIAIALATSSDNTPSHYVAVNSLPSTSVSTSPSAPGTIPFVSGTSTAGKSALPSAKSSSAAPRTAAPGRRGSTTTYVAPRGGGGDTTASQPSPTTHRPAPPKPTPTRPADSGPIAVSGDGGVVSAINSYRRSHNLSSITGGYSSSLSHCLVSNPNGPCGQNGAYGTAFSMNGSAGLNVLQADNPSALNAKYMVSAQVGWVRYNHADGSTSWAVAISTFDCDPNGGFSC